MPEGHASGHGRRAEATANGRREVRQLVDLLRVMARVKASATRRSPASPECRSPVWCGTSRAGASPRSSSCSLPCERSGWGPGVSSRWPIPRSSGSSATPVVSAACRRWAGVRYPRERPGVAPEEDGRAKGSSGFKRAWIRYSELHCGGEVGRRPPRFANSFTRDWRLRRPALPPSLARDAPAPRRPRPHRSRSNSLGSAGTLF